MHHTATTLEDISLSRLTDPVFLLMLLSLRRPAESHRVEMLYDVLLPWLARGPLSSSSSSSLSSSSSSSVPSTKTYKDRQFRTPSRAYQTSGYRSLLESVRFVLNLSKSQWKCLTYHIRVQLLKDCRDPLKTNTSELDIAEHQLLRANAKHLGKKKPKRLLLLSGKNINVSNIVSHSNLNATSHIYTIHSHSTTAYRGHITTLSSHIMTFDLNLNTKPETMNDILNILKSTNQLILNMNSSSNNTNNKNSTARQHEIIQLISHLFLKTLPIPNKKIFSTIWTPSNNKQQHKVLKYLYNILYMFGLMWQDVTNPTRAFESQRALVAMCVLVMFDAVVRNGDSIFSNVFRDEFYFSTNVGRSLIGSPVHVASAAFEFWDPEMCIRRNEALRYLMSREKSCTFSIFNMSVSSIGSGPAVELNKMDSTIGFLRRILIEFKLPVVPKHPKSPSEMHALLCWFSTGSSGVEKPFCDLDKRCTFFDICNVVV